MAGVGVQRMAKLELKAQLTKACESYVSSMSQSWARILFQVIVLCNSHSSSEAGWRSAHALGLVIILPKDRSSSGHCGGMSAVFPTYKTEVEGIPCRPFIRVQFRQDTHPLHCLP